MSLLPHSGSIGRGAPRNHGRACLIASIKVMDFGRVTSYNELVKTRLWICEGRYRHESIGSGKNQKVFGIEARRFLSGCF